MIQIQQMLDREQAAFAKYASTNYHSAHPTKAPTAEQLAEINEHIAKGERQQALDNPITYYGIDTSNVNDTVTYVHLRGGPGRQGGDR